MSLLLCRWETTIHLQLSLRTYKSNNSSPTGSGLLVMSFLLSVQGFHKLVIANDLSLLLALSSFFLYREGVALVSYI